MERLRVRPRVALPEGVPAGDDGLTFLDCHRRRGAGRVVRRLVAVRQHAERQRPVGRPLQHRLRDVGDAQAVQALDGPLQLRNREEDGDGRRARDESRHQADERVRERRAVLRVARELDQHVAEARGAVERAVVLPHHARNPVQQQQRDAPRRRRVVFRGDVHRGMQHVRDLAVERLGDGGRQGALPHAVRERVDALDAELRRHRGVRAAREAGVQVQHAAHEQAHRRRGGADDVAVVDARRERQQPLDVRQLHARPVGVLPAVLL
mmetsp:Transcript_12312/g.38299  ORF Transcript_12312/g.38299 Transcript_12312/m.38299 type:complete len:266 (-) Transcript_12312:1189-1986(-)